MPMVNKTFNAIEIVNELTLLSSFYILLIFSDANNSARVLSSSGNVMIGLVLLNVIINFALIISKVGSAI
jgi:hypothetical protein